MKNELTSRVHIHKAYEEIKDFIQPMIIGETFSDTKQRVFNAINR